MRMQNVQSKKTTRSQFSLLFTTVTARTKVYQTRRLTGKTKKKNIEQSRVCKGSLMKRAGFMVGRI